VFYCLSEELGSIIDKDVNLQANKKAAIAALSGLFLIIFNVYVMTVACQLVVIMVHKIPD